MGLGRSVLLWASRNKTLRETLPRYGFVRRSVSRFMPGEQISDALDAADRLRDSGIPTVLTHLGENVTDEKETHEVTNHYLQVLDDIHARKLDTHISVKLTELGLDQDLNLCFANLKSLLEKAQALDNFVWIDMEASAYTDRTLQIYRQARSGYPNAGLCLQSYLYRTMEDLNTLLPLSPAIRLVKGAYAEPANIAFPKKNDNDENYYKLALRLLDAGGAQKGFATHDPILIEKIRKAAMEKGIAEKAYEVQMLYGIRAEDQKRLVRENLRVRVLISYGTYWFPWYMRRLAERPANVWFVMRNLFR